MKHITFVNGVVLYVTERYMLGVDLQQLRPAVCNGEIHVGCGTTTVETRLEKRGTNAS